MVPGLLKIVDLWCQLESNSHQALGMFCKIKQQSNSVFKRLLRIQILFFGQAAERRPKLVMYLRSFCCFIMFVCWCIIFVSWQVSISFSIATPILGSHMKWSHITIIFWAIFAKHYHQSSLYQTKWNFHHLFDSNRDIHYSNMLQKSAQPTWPMNLCVPYFFWSLDISQDSNFRISEFLKFWIFAP